MRQSKRLFHHGITQPQNLQPSEQSLQGMDDIRWIELLKAMVDVTLHSVSSSRQVVTHPFLNRFDAIGISSSQHTCNAVAVHSSHDVRNHSLSQTGSMLGVSYRLSGFCILRLHSILCSWLYAVTRSPVYSKGTDRQSSGTPQACQDSKHRGSYAIVPVLSAQNPDIDFKKQTPYYFFRTDSIAEKMLN